MFRQPAPRNLADVAGADHRRAAPSPGTLGRPHCGAQDVAEFCNQRFLCDRRKGLGRTDFQLLNLSCPDRLVNPDPENQRRGPRLAFLRPWFLRHRGERLHRRQERWPRGSRRSQSLRWTYAVRG
jgi:hypothetical protein